MTESRRSLILTGASRGIGHATVKRFSDEGWQLITCSRDPVPAHCERDPNWTSHIPTDLGDPDDVDRFIDEANALLGDSPLNALVNNAAVSPKTDFQERLGCLNGSLDDWREVFQLNFFTPLALARGFAPALARASKMDVDDPDATATQGHASIVNITHSQQTRTQYWARSPMRVHINLVHIRINLLAVFYLFYYTRLVEKRSMLPKCRMDVKFHRQNGEIVLLLNFFFAHFRGYILGV